VNRTVEPEVARKIMDEFDANKVVEQKQQVQEKGPINQVPLEKERFFDISSGLALIISNEDFKKEFNPRAGGAVDVEKLDKLFSDLGFAVTTAKNLKQKEIQKTVQRFKNSITTNIDMVIISILSHGDNGNLVDIDGEELDIEEEIISQFYNTSCEVLVGKPKLFLLQYCRGDKRDMGKQVPTGAETRASRPPDDIVLPSTKIPGVTDVLIANSTVPGFVSNRNTRDGTWFVQCFEKVVREGIKHKMDIRDMFDRMQEKMQEMESKNPNENINEKRKQTFELVNRGFTKKLYLNKSLKS